MDPTLARLNKWYKSQCDGDWEHGSGIKIDTLDNPGWLIQINLAGTKLERKPFSSRVEGLEVLVDGRAHPAKKRWHSISVKGSTFEAAGDPSKLEFMLQTFLDWAEAPERPAPKSQE